ncbi:hypothetical protein [Hyphomonas pacifica]|uniref:Uncharacterized protein n=1 Tax=Hyphomonas pacifica TaxID=1280941 RepID=A0A062U0F2_9PROT|nr:hypothetical protein [Hyphomonas pacifica]KCZ51757.1 hypothetical protein HY2_10725 [Hyphomonas pacifica]RAN30672.1 hypothetical protein HY3_05850 [Hyphomonas pacifica]RAN38098.1 hypothetical protein HY11_07480 [Hyphomonas pacifica]
MKNTAIPLIGVSCLLLAGCAGSFGKVQTAINRAPDWYDQRRVEIRGEGYPQIIDVPEIEQGSEPGQTLEASRARSDVLRAEFETSARAVPPANVAAEIASLRETVQRGFAGFQAEADFLTEEEIEAIRSAFDVPRVTKGLKAASR